MKSPEEIADEIIETANDATRIVDGAHSCPAGHDDEDVDYFCCGCLRSMIAAAISAERSAGLSDGGKDRKATGELSDAPKPAPAPVRPPAVRVPTPEEIAAMPLEQVAAETARLKRETGAVGGISRCEPAPACARCGGSGYLCPVCSRSECFQGAPCPACRGKP